MVLLVSSKHALTNWRVYAEGYIKRPRLLSILFVRPLSFSDLPIVCTKLEANLLHRNTELCIYRVCIDLYGQHVPLFAVFPPSYSEVAIPVSTAPPCSATVAEAEIPGNTIDPVVPFEIADEIVCSVRK